MNKLNQDFRGKKISQESLSRNFQGAILGITLRVKFLLAFWAFSLNALSGCLAGILGAIIILSLFYSEQTEKGIWLTVCIGCVTTVWMLKATHPNMVNSLCLSGLIAIIISTLATITLQEPNFIWLILPLSLFFLGGYISVVTISTFSLLALKCLLKHSLYRQASFFNKVLTFLLSSLTSYLLSNAFHLHTKILSPYFVGVRFLAGFLIGFSAINLSLYILGEKKDFMSLRKMAVTLSTFGSTSFYNLDLSGVDFTSSNLANTDFRALVFYRTCLRNVVGLDRARVDNRYFDLDNLAVQTLLTQGSCQEKNFANMNLQGAYLQEANMKDFDLTNANLAGADLQKADMREGILIRTQLAGANCKNADLRKNNLTDANLTEAELCHADLRYAVLVRAQVARADFTRSDLTGICIEDWSVSSKTNFTDVRCDYVFRQYEDGQPTHRYPSDRNFEPGEFATLFQPPQNELELIFKGSFSYSALSLAFYKLKTEKPELDLELKGIEQRGNLWVVLVTSNNPAIESQLEQQFSRVYQTTTSDDVIETTIKDAIYRDYEDIKQRWADSQQLVRQLAGISESQAEALKQLSKQAFGANFYISGSTITNLTGQGQIEYREAAGQIRSLVTGHGTEAQVAQGSQSFLAQLQDVATTPYLQAELIQQILVTEAQRDRAFKRFLQQQQQQILAVLPSGTIASAIRGAIAQLNDVKGHGNVI